MLDALGAALLAALLYGTTLQTGLYGVDAAALIGMVGGVEPDLSFHVLYTRLGRLVLLLLPAADPILVMRWVSVVGAALTIGCTHALCRGFGAERASAWTACLLLASAPAQWFFATTVEVYPLHTATVGFCACLVVFGPWHRPALATTLAIATSPLLFLTHQTGALLLPGWLLLLLFARRRAGLAVSCRNAALLAAGLLAGFVLAVSLTNAARELGGTPDPSDSLRVLRHFWNWRPWIVLRDGAVHGLALLWLPAGAALLALRRERFTLLVLLVLLLPSFVFFLGWGQVENGAYFLATAPFVAVLASRAPRLTALRLFPLWALLLVPQLWLARDFVATRDNHLDPRLRVLALRTTLGTGGTVISADGIAPNARLDLPQVEEISLLHFLGPLAAERPDPDNWVQTALLPALRHLLASRESPLVLDLGYRLHPEDLGAGLPYLEALERALERDFRTTRVEEPWPLLLIEG